MNEQYVRRGEVAFDLSFIGSWNDELEEMNSGKLTFSRTAIYHVVQ